MFPRDRLKGLALAVTGVLILTPDSLIMRLVGADPWTVLFWRGLFMSLGYIVLMALWYRGAFFSAIRRVGMTGVLVAALFTFNTVTFVVAISLTTVANVLVIIAAAPLFAAIIGWVALGEQPPVRTWAAILMAMGGIVLIVQEGISTGSGYGDLAALMTAASLGAHFVLVRSARPIDMTPAVGLSGLLTAGIAFVVAGSLALDPVQLGWMALLGIVVLPISFALITVAPIYMPAADVGLVLLLETVLGPLWVWLVMQEQPGDNALIGGGVVISALILNFALTRRRVPSV